MNYWLQTEERGRWTSHLTSLTVGGYPNELSLRLLMYASPLASQTETNTLAFFIVIYYQN